tara:strand:- start:150 stop:314 length:165 start_codon:yes stop_codon:yes gene_type:complete
MTNIFPVADNVAEIMRRNLIGIGIIIENGRVIMPISSIGYYIQSIIRFPLREKT